MTPDEVIAEIKEWMKNTGKDGDGNPVNVIGEIEYPHHCFMWSRDWDVVPDADARHYITGWLHDWFVKLGKKCWDVMPENLCFDVLGAGSTGSYLPALWAAYKAVNKIEVAKCSGLNGS